MKAADYWTVQAMKNCGGSFVRALAEAAKLADDTNFALIKVTWPVYWAKYQPLGAKLAAEDAAAQAVRIASEDMRAQNTAVRTSDP